MTPAPDSSAVYTSKVVVVGVTGRYQLTNTDRAVIGANLDDVQAGAISVRPRYIGDCAASGWATLGAGRRTSVGGLCDPQVRDRRVVDWPQRLAAAAARSGDARLGTLAASGSGCVAAVGPGAALAAARPDGSLAAFATPQAFLAAGSTGCPITLVDPGSSADAIIQQVARQRDVTLFVTGIGPSAGSDDPGVQLVYRLGTTLPGWLTSASTRRDGIITLADLTRTLIDFGRSSATPTTLPIDGSPLEVVEATLTTAEIEDHLEEVAALSDAALVGYRTLGVGGALLLVMAGIGVATRRFALPRLVTTYGCVLAAVMMLNGAVPWWQSSSPGLFLSVLVTVWSVLLTSVAFVLARLVKVPLAVAGAGLVVAAFTVEAALGGVMEPGSLLNSRPVAGGRWYGFGNVTFAVYVQAGLVLAGFLAHRFRRLGRPYVGLVAAAVVGFGVVICEGWPTMGTDFGGVISFTPGLLYLLLLLSGVRITALKLAAIGAAAVVAITGISLADWLRGPEQRSHLGNFVQRVIDGDAQAVVIRKAVTSVETIVGPVGIGAVVIGALVWFAMFRFVLPVVADAYSTIGPVAIAVLATAVLGTLLNDGGVYVWLTITATFTLTVASLWLDRALLDGHLTWAVRASR